jgi:hypothetical protein
MSVTAHPPTQYNIPEDLLLQAYNILSVAFVGISVIYLSVLCLRNLFVNIFLSNFSKSLIFLDVTVSTVCCYLNPDRHSFKFSDTAFITYLLTPWSRVLLEKQTVNFAASQEIPRIYGTRKSLTVPTNSRHLSLS